MDRKVIYYQNELTDEFSKAVITPRAIDKNYKYSGSALWWVGHFFLYRGFARPFAYLFTKLVWGHRIVGREKLKGINKFYLYGNHTNAAADPFIPSVLCYPTQVDVIVHPANVSMPVGGRITPFLGALPLPDDLDAMRNFQKEIKYRLSKGHAITIYPEAHIWPYYTKIRPFVPDSFGYAINDDLPCFCFTNTYQKRRFFKKPRMVTYIDGPFYPDLSLTKREAKQRLRDQVYEAMTDRAKNNNVELIEYRRGEES
ncbi:MAG: hypothetical protein K6D96_01425 [Acetatifactor sp.]|nr:hypothetical protein [Acetatifactor sp.]